MLPTQETNTYRPERETQKIPNAGFLGAQLYQLQLLQAKYYELQALIEQGSNYKHPSYLKYGVLLGFSSLIDIVDLLDLTGVGAIVGRLFSLFVSAILLYIYWLTNTKQIKAKEYVQDLASKVEDVEKYMAKASRLYSKISNNKISGPGIYNKIARSRGKTVIISKSPGTKIVAGSVANLVPFVAVVPWTMLGVIFSYLDEKKIIANARIEAEKMVPYLKLLSQQISYLSEQISSAYAEAGAFPNA